MSGLTRRQFIAGLGGLAGVQLVGPLVVRAGAAFGQTAVDPAAANRRRLVVIFQSGGNDGLNLVIPRGDVSGAARYSVYRKVRPSIAYKPEEVLALNRPSDDAHQLGINPKMPKVHQMYKEGRVAVVQGVDYPNHNYSHFTSTDIWQSGEPVAAPNSGWLGRHLDRAGIGDGELRAVGVGHQLPLLFRGRDRQGVEIVDIPSTHFYDGAEAAARARQDATRLFGDHPGEEALRQVAGRLSRSTVGIVRTLESAKPPPVTNVPITDALVTARVLLEQNLGVETVFVEQPGYDTHTTQRQGQEALLSQIDEAVARFWLELKPAIAERTLVMTISEFGRRIGEAGIGAGAGTDHGAAAPVLIIGPPRSTLVGGIHGEHPNMGSVALPADNLEMTTDLRRVYQAMLTSWLGDSEPLYAKRYPALPGLFNR